MKLNPKNIKLTPLLTLLIITLAYPAAKGFTAEARGLLVFTDVLTIVASLLLIAGVVYSLVLHGDFDIATFALNRGMRKDMKQDFRAFKEDKDEEREEAFNYPLFLGLAYYAVALIIAYGFL